MVGDSGARQLSDQLQNILKEVDEKRIAIFDALTSAANTELADFLNIDDDIVKLRDAFDAVAAPYIDTWGDIINDAILPWIITSETSPAWTSIENSAKEIVTAIASDKIQLGGAWYGTAADAYRNSAQRQSDAAQRLSEIAQKADKKLDNVAKAAKKLYLKILIGLIKLAIQIAAAIAAAASVVGAPIAVPLTLNILRALGSFILTITKAAALFALKQALAVRALNKEAQSSEGFPGGKWPQAAPGSFQNSPTDSKDWGPVGVDTPGTPGPNEQETSPGPSEVGARPPEVPDNWVHKEPRNGQGDIWQAPNLPPGAHRDANSERIVPPGVDSRYPDGYVRFYNEHGQAVDINGKPGNRANSHIPRNPDGSYPIPKGWSE